MASRSFITCVSLCALLGACSAGTGPIDIPSIGQREPPTSGAGTRESPGSSSGSRDSTKSPAGTGNTPTNNEGGNNPSRPATDAGGTTPGGGSTATGCTALSVCCASLAAGSTKDDCNELVKDANDSNCSKALDAARKASPPICQ